MNKEVYDTLLEALTEDYKLFVKKFEDKAEKHPDLEFEEVSAMVVHEPEKDLPENIRKLMEEYPYEYATAADSVYMAAVLDALLGGDV